MYCTRAASAHMKKQNYGRILCTSSAHRIGLPGPGILLHRQGRDTRLARTVAREMAKHGTTCNVLRPIALWRGPGPKIREPRIEANKPEDVAALATYLVSEAAEHISGWHF